MSDTAPTTKFAILMPWGRVGSNTLLNVLGQFDGMKLVNERYTGIRSRNKDASEAKISDMQNTWFDEFFQGLSDEGQNGGAKFSALSIGDPDTFVALARKHQLKMIYMDRHDLVKTAISAVKAEVYAEFHKKKFGKPTWAVKAGREHYEKIHIDTNKLRDYMEFCANGRSIMQGIRARIPGLSVFYEDILVDIDHEICRVLKALNINQFDYEIAYVKATHDDLTQVISNYDEVMVELDALGVSFRDAA